MFGKLEKLAEWYLTHIRVRKMLKDAKATEKAKQQSDVKIIPLIPKGFVQPAKKGTKFATISSSPLNFDNPKMILVPEFDYQLLRTIRINLGSNVTTDIYPPEKLMQLEGNIDTDLANKMQFKNAEQLHKFYGFSKQEVLEITGCHLK